MRPIASAAILPKGGSPAIQGEAAANIVVSHVTAFIEERLQNSRGASIAASEIRSAYEVWCDAHGHTPLSSPKFAAELKALGYDKSKSCGLIRYRDLQVA
jgi:phage/plasmid-associated DNA primase